MGVMLNVVKSGQRKEGLKYIFAVSSLRIVAKLFLCCHLSSDFTLLAEQSVSLVHLSIIAFLTLGRVLY